MLLNISDKYRVTGIPLNFVLKEKGISKEGKVVWKTTGYYPTLESLFRCMIKENIIDTEGEVKQVVDKIDEVCEKILTAIKEKKK